MKPIIFEDEKEEQIVISENQMHEGIWYDYIAQNEGTENGGSSKWANAITLDGSMWVWIPRYAYKIEKASGEQNGTIEIQFLNGNTNFNKSNEDVTKLGYSVHPAFKDGQKNGVAEKIKAGIISFRENDITDEQRNNQDDYRIGEDEVLLKPGKLVTKWMDYQPRTLKTALEEAASKFELFDRNEEKNIDTNKNMMQFLVLITENAGNYSKKVIEDAQFKLNLLSKDSMINIQAMFLNNYKKDLVKGITMLTDYTTVGIQEIKKANGSKFVVCWWSNNISNIY